MDVWMQASENSGLVSWCDDEPLMEDGRKRLKSTVSRLRSFRLSSLKREFNYQQKRWRSAVLCDDKELVLLHKKEMVNLKKKVKSETRRLQFGVVAGRWKQFEEEFSQVNIKWWKALIGKQDENKGLGSLRMLVKHL